MAGRGARGILGISRQFRIADDNNDKTLSMQEFTKCIRDFRVDISPEEIRQLFEFLDRDGNGSIDYNEFLYGVRGSMNSFRKTIVLQAFDKMDRDGSGILDINDIKGIYDASHHPDVKQRKKTEDEVLTEFLQTFEAHHDMSHNWQPDGRVEK